MKISGIYKIVNKIDGNYYIGSSINIHKRWLRHKYDLNNKKHANKHLQNSWNKYGIDNFDFVIISIFSRDNIKSILEEEERLLTIHCGNSKCYNINIGVLNLNNSNNPFYGKHHSEKTKKIISEKRKIFYKNNIHPWIGKNHSDKTKLKISLSKKGKTLENKHPQYDFTIYTFKKENEIYIGTRFNFCKKYNLSMGNVCWLIKGKNKSVKGWTIKNRTNISIDPNLIIT